jgi:hypothetical protein
MCLEHILQELRGIIRSKKLRKQLGITAGLKYTKKRQVKLFCNIPGFRDLNANHTVTNKHYRNNRFRKYFKEDESTE